MNKEKIMEGVKLILEGVGEDVNREGLIETPDRIARMYMEIFEGIGKDAKEVLSKTFSVENNDLVLEKDITFFWRSLWHQRHRNVLILHSLQAKKVLKYLSVMCSDTHLSLQRLKSLF